MRNGVSMSPRMGSTAMNHCSQPGKRGSGIAIPEKKKIGAGASREMPSPEIVHNNEMVRSAVIEAASSNPPSKETTNMTPAATEAGPRSPKNSPAKRKIGNARMKMGADCQLESSVPAKV